MQVDVIQVADRFLKNLERRVRREAKAHSGGRSVEDHLRGPTQRLVEGITEALGRPVTCSGESPAPGIGAVPDFMVVDALGRTVGWIELKAPGTGADPTKYQGRNAEQWAELSQLPNVLYSDGEDWTLWDLGTEVDGASDPEGLVRLLSTFTAHDPIPPRSTDELAVGLARACQLLRDHTRGALAGPSGRVLRGLAESWRKLLFPNLHDDEFADAYAQTVTFALVAARAHGAAYTGDGEADVSIAIERLHSHWQTRQEEPLLSEALSNLCHPQVLIETSVGIEAVVGLLAVTDVALLVDAGDWLYFYENFLATYDPELRKKSGSYYTPAPLVEFMVEFADTVLREHLGKHRGFADPTVTVVDPATGTGTFLLAVIDRIARSVANRDGVAMAPAELEAAAGRLFGFEIQAGPFAVAQFRTAAAYARHAAGGAPTVLLADTLDDPYQASEVLALPTLQAITAQRRTANKVKTETPVMVAIGNPPYRRSVPRSEGGWVASVLMNDWRPGPDQNVGAHAQNLANLLVYFWRWAAWKVLENSPKPGGVDEDRTSAEKAEAAGVICFVTSSAWLKGLGFKQMRRWLREQCSDIWVVDLSPEGFRPDVPTRVFQEVQHEVCVVTAVRAPQTTGDQPAAIRYRQVTPGSREAKFTEFARLAELADPEWIVCPQGWEDPFTPAGDEIWEQAPTVSDLAPWSTSGVTGNRTWPINPDQGVLRARWNELIAAPDQDEMRKLLKVTRDIDIDSTFDKPLAGQPTEQMNGPLWDEEGSCPDTVRFALRSFDRQWIIRDRRLLDMPRPPLWHAHGHNQSYLTFLVEPFMNGPGVTFACLLPELAHYRGHSGGRVHPLWRNANASEPNLTPGLIDYLMAVLGTPVAPEDMFSYIAAICAHPAFTAWRNGVSPHSQELRIPVTAEVGLWNESVRLGRKVIWAHTFGERFADPIQGRDPGPNPRVDDGPVWSAAVPHDADRHPNTIGYDSAAGRIILGEGADAGWIENVVPEVWSYRVSGMSPIESWFKYRKREPDVKWSSPLNDTVRQGWLHEWSLELLDVCHALTALVRLEPEQAALLDLVLDSPQITIENLTDAEVLPVPVGATKAPKVPKPGDAPLLEA